MSVIMQQSASQQDLFVHSHYLFASPTFPFGPSPNVDNDRHEAQLQLQDRMCNPALFHAKMMVDFYNFTMILSIHM